jgi:hypothetical protein
MSEREHAAAQSLGPRFNDLADSAACHRCGRANALVDFGQLHIVSGSVDGRS